MKIGDCIPATVWNSMSREEQNRLRKYLQFLGFPVLGICVPLQRISENSIVELKPIGILIEFEKFAMPQCILSRYDIRKMIELSPV